MIKNPKKSLDFLFFLLILIENELCLLYNKHVCRSGGMADAQVSDACGGNTVWVQIPSPAPCSSCLRLFLLKCLVLFRMIIQY